MMVLSDPLARDQPSRAFGWSIPRLALDLELQGLVINGCRFQDTIADGCNVNYGMQSTLVTNCTTRGAGDDCFAFWPANSTETYNPASNVVTHCTGQLNFLANGGALYGGEASSRTVCSSIITYGYARQFDLCGGDQCVQRNHRCPALRPDS